MLLRDAILESFAKQEKCNGAVGAQENQEDFVGFIRESLSTAEIQTPHIVVGELTSECKTVPWIRFQRYEEVLVVVCFFYAHHGSWLLEFECPSFTIAIGLSCWTKLHLVLGSNDCFRWDQLLQRRQAVLVQRMLSDGMSTGFCG